MQKNNKVDTLYESQTINSPNPFVKLSHRTRNNIGFDFVQKRINLGNVLDYGSGTGVFVSRINKLKPGSITGYEPFYEPRYEENLPIYEDYETILAAAPYHTITIFQVFEHLHWTEIERILNRFDDLLSPDGVILIEVPIEIGPVILPKELNRLWQKKKGYTSYYQMWDYKFWEFLGTFFLGIPGRRINPETEFMKHKGFDFRQLIQFIREKGWTANILCYSPLPIKTWYGNSNVFIEVKRSDDTRKIAEKI